MSYFHKTDGIVHREYFSSLLISGFVVFLLLSLVLQNTRFPLKGAYIATVFAYLYAIFIFLMYKENEIIIKYREVLLLLLFVFISFINSSLNPLLFNYSRLIVLLTFTAMNFYLMPKIIDFGRLLSIISRMSAIIVVIGLLPLIGFPTQIGFIDISLWGVFSDFGIPIITSVFVNPNQLGFFALVGVIGALREQYPSNSLISRSLLWINGLGLVLSHYRTGWIALLAATGLLYSYILWGRLGLVAVTTGGIVSIVIGLAMLFGVVPAPKAVTEMSLNGRRELWTLSVHALQNNILIGNGLYGTVEIVDNPHNSYLRMFSSFGLVGGTTYTLIVTGTTIGSARQTKSFKEVFLVMVLFSVMLIQLFNQLSFIGVSMRSVLIAITMGYYLTK